MTYRRDRALEVYEHFCKDVLMGYLSHKFGIESANLQIIEKREALESRWSVKLPVYRIT